MTRWRTRHRRKSPRPRRGWPKARPTPLAKIRELRALAAAAQEDGLPPCVCGHSKSDHAGEGQMRWRLFCEFPGCNCQDYRTEDRCAGCGKVVKAGGGNWDNLYFWMTCPDCDSEEVAAGLVEHVLYPNGRPARA